MIRIPKTNSYGQTMTYYHVISDTRMKRIIRFDFFELIRTTANGEAHILPDFEGAVVYFVPDGERYATMSRIFRREAECQHKQYISHYECVLKGTPLCDGWKDTPNREHYCEACTNRHICRTISLNAVIEDDEGNKTELGNLIADEDSDSPEEVVTHNEDLEELRRVLDHIPEKDREYILNRYKDGMNFTKLAKMYGIDWCYASKRAGRIEERIRKKFC